MTKIRWGPALLPRLRNELVRDHRRVVDRLHPLAATQPPHADLNRLAALATVAADQLEQAELIWVATDMAAATLDASLDIPLIDPELAPWTTGLLVFERPLPPLPTRRPLTLLDHTTWSDPLPVDAVSWHLHGAHLHVTRYCRRGAFPGPGVQDGELQEVAGIRFRRDQPLDLAAAEHHLAEIDGHPPDDLRVLAMLAAAWVLMLTPTIADRRWLDPATTTVTRPADDAPATAHPNRVTLIDLRPMRHVTVERGDSGRVYRHRWIVRGHWRQQQYGPKATLRRPVWIESYTKGPQGAPLLTTDKVLVWRH